MEVTHTAHVESAESAEETQARVLAGLQRLVHQGMPIEDVSRWVISSLELLEHDTMEPPQMPDKSVPRPVSTPRETSSETAVVRRAFQRSAEGAGASGGRAIADDRREGSDAASSSLNASILRPQCGLPDPANPGPSLKHRSAHRPRPSPSRPLNTSRNWRQRSPACGACATRRSFPSASWVCRARPTRRSCSSSRRRPRWPSTAGRRSSASGACRAHPTRGPCPRSCSRPWHDRNPWPTCWPHPTGRPGCTGPTCCRLAYVASPIQLLLERHGKQHGAKHGPK